jgi:hypothetical protein
MGPEREETYGLLRASHDSASYYTARFQASGGGDR